MGLDWIKSHKELERHPKTLRFRALMGWNLNETVGFLHRFWWWALDAAPDGVVSDVCGPGVCGEAFGLRSDTGDKVIENMLSAGWLDALDDGSVVIHNHDRRRGRSEEQLEGGKKRQKEYRERKRRERYAGVTHNAGITEESVTRPDKKRSDRETDPPPPPAAGGGPGARAGFSSFDSMEAGFSPSYLRVLDTYREASGIACPPDPNTREGARTIASMMDAGGLDIAYVAPAIAKGLADKKLPNQGLRGIANNLHRYLPDKPPPRPEDAKRRCHIKCDSCRNEEWRELTRAEMDGYPHPCGSVLGLARDAPECGGMMRVEGWR